MCAGGHLAPCALGETASHGHPAPLGSLAGFTAPDRRCAVWMRGMEPPRPIARSRSGIANHSHSNGAGTTRRRPMFRRSLQLLLALACVGANLAAPLVAHPAAARAAEAPGAPPIRWGYYVTYAADSLVSLKANIDALT